MPSKKKQLQTERASSRQISPVALFSKRARTWIVAVCSVALICFVLLPLCLDRLSSANTQSAAAIGQADASELERAAEPLTAAAPSTPEPTATPDEGSPATPEVHVSQYSTLKVDDKYPAVIQLHSRLVTLGYLESDEPSEWYNDATADAVSLFQRTLNLEMTGVADSALQEKLFSTDAASYEAKLGDNGSDVRSMQSLLAELGYYDGKVNGYFGVATEEALKAFQSKNDMDVDGVFHMDDRDLLYSQDAKPAVDPTPVPTPKPTPKPTKKPTVTQKPETTKKPSSATPRPDGGSDVVIPVDPPEPEETSVIGVPEDPATPTPVPLVTPEPIEPPSDGGNTSYGSGIDAMIACAQDQIGKRYVLGDEGPNSFDCSGLVYYCLTKAGVKTTRFSANSFSKVDKWTLISSMDDLQRGDLLFFTDDGASRVTHTGIYIGGGTMIDASSSNKKVVKRSCTTSYWTRNFVCARRVF